VTDSLVHVGPVMTTAFLASLVEAVEAMTIVLAVATVRGWRPAGLGALAGLLVLAFIVVALGPLLDRLPLSLLQLAIGILLLLFGMRWLRKAILRMAGVIPLHDEATTFTAETAELREQARRDEVRLDGLAALASFKAVLLEGLEVVFIVIALSAGRGMLVPASAGAVAACLLVTGVGIVVHRPLARVPENTLKFAVGVMLSAFGVFWTGEGLGVAWPGADLAIVGFAVLFHAASATGGGRHLVVWVPRRASCECDKSCPLPVTLRIAGQSAGANREDPHAIFRFICAQARSRCFVDCGCGHRRHNVRGRAKRGAEHHNALAPGAKGDCAA
jgi:Ca2+/H+ antiporter, TMEM165/GDT1 family